jgi:uncharacterized iron-regulated membrane protein
MAGRVWLRADRWLTWFHRWVGVALCLVFFIWFATGAVLHFVDFPALSDNDRYTAGDAIDGAKLRVAPADLVNSYPAMDDLRLISVVGRPVYIVSSPTSGLTAVAGDSGERIPSISAATARIAAERFAGTHASDAQGPLSYDQWIVHQRFDPYRPFFRVRIDDVAKTDVYVSARTGEVVQRTRRSERVWNWCGAVLHWIYFTPLRRSWSAWNQTVWWISLVAFLTAVVGTWLGVQRLIANRLARRHGLSPFRRWMRWHHIIGLFSAVILLGWILSGWLSMDHGRFFSTGRTGTQEADRMRGMPFSAVARNATLSDVQAALPTAEIDFEAINGQPFLLARGSTNRQLWFRPPSGEGGRISSALDGPELTGALRRVWPDAPVIAVANDGRDALYRLAESVPPGAFGAEVLLSAGTIRVYVDQYTGRLLTAMNASRRDYAWIYYALHTLNFPILLGVPLVRTALVMILLAVGLGFSATGVVLGISRLRRELRVVN